MDYAVTTKICLYFFNCAEGEVDKETLLCLTERAVEHLVPVLGHRMKFLKVLEAFKREAGENEGRSSSSETSDLNELEVM